ncbi:MAG: AAA family ATPase [Lachnospiraceae bacterium]|nr:AAA family ATPase [Lachnospiraceae bacterium]
MGTRDFRKGAGNGRGSKPEGGIRIIQCHKAYGHGARKGTGEDNCRRKSEGCTKCKRKGAGTEARKDDAEGTERAECRSREYRGERRKHQIIVGRMYKSMGILSKGHFVEVSRTDLIAGYQGQTALKVKKVIEEAKGGVLFIDEAYSITENDHSDSYGRECLTELTKALEDYRDDLVVIVAGYTEPMRKFFDSNPGLKSRFNTFIEFEDYSPKALVEILSLICKINDYKLDDAMETDLERFFEKESEQKDEHFANARLARNLYDDMTMAHAKRVINIVNPSKQDLSTIMMIDFGVALDTYKHSSIEEKR